VLHLAWRRSPVPAPWEEIIVRRTLSVVLAVGMLGGGVLGLVPGAAAAGEGHDGSGGPGRGPNAGQPVLEARATLSADFIAPGPPSGAQATPANGRTGPFPGQVIPGFSGMLDNGDGTFLALPDNGFGAKDNSADFLLRLYTITPQWETADGGSGEIEVGDFISLRDPDGRIPFPIVNDGTDERLLTGGDFDVESVVRAPDGTLWIGEEFGPFLLHVDATGRLLAPPVEFPDGKSPGNPFLQPGETPRVPSSRGFEAMAASPDGRRIYPIVEGAFTDDPVARRRFIYEFDLASESYTGRTWQYETDRDANVIGDAYMTDGEHMVLIERDDFQGPASVTKRLYEISLRRPDRDGFVHKTLFADLLRIANPALIGTEASPGAYGVDDPFAFALQSVEVVVRLADGRFLVGLDNNYPGGNGRISGTPDDTELIVIDLERVRPDGRDGRDPLVIGHRGASGYRPEHTLAAYGTAILQCADYIEPDLVATKDGVLVARHENEIGGTTDVADRPEFADRFTTKVVDGESISGWFTEDFTLAELKTLRATERIPDVRPANTAFDGLYEVPTFDEVVDLARRSRTCDGDPVGVYPETKHPTYFDSIGLSLEEPLLQDLRANGWGRGDAPVYIQSFETGNLRELARMTSLPLVQLIGCSGAPFDLAVVGDPRTYADLATPSGLRGVARYADGVGVCKDVLIPRDASDNLLTPTPVLGDAHRAGLEVHAWTFRVENTFLPRQFRSGTDPAAPGDLAGEIDAFLAAGLDGFFTDNPDIGVAAAG
jgi:glycerophosphoryl diester phosphodiesterase